MLPPSSGCVLFGSVIGSAGGAGAGIFIIVVWLIVAIFAAALYFVPTIIAGMRHHPQTVAIGALNFLLGWTFLGWLGALVWCLTNTTHQVMVVNQWSPVGYSTPPPPPAQARPGWYPDPSGRTRYWSGTAWTEHIR